MHFNMQFIHVMQKLIFRQPYTSFSVKSSFRNIYNIELVLKRHFFLYQCKSYFFQLFMKS